MPELPEVETVRRELEPWLPGRRIRDARLVDAPPGPKYRDLERAIGQTIEAVNRRGKFLLLPLSGGDELVIHLGMTGIIAPERPPEHLRVQLELDGPAPDQLYFRDTRRFGRFLVVPGGEYEGLPTLDRMGPEPLGEEFELAGFLRALKRSRSALKTYLLSQRPVAGLGNIYVDEALWRARIAPTVPARKIGRTRGKRLMEAIRTVLERSIELQGTTLNDYRTVNGGVGEYLTELEAYGHEGDSCSRCDTPIEKIKLGGRSTHFCPRCQPR